MSIILPAITLWQPWASLVFEPGYKEHETRGYRYPEKYQGQRIAIHAAAALPAERHFHRDLLDVCYDAFGCAWNHSLPRGCVIGTAVLAYCLPVTELHPTDEDRICGDWSPGRFAWFLSGHELFDAPVPAKGKQGWWKWSPESAPTIEGRAE